MVASVTPMRDIDKFKKGTKRYVFGETLLEALKESDPNLDSLTGYRCYNPFMFWEEESYRITGGGLLGRFGRRLVEVAPLNTCGDMVVRVHDESLRTVVSEVVRDLNNQGGIDFKLEYM
ncbi:MAG: hypothetical protein ABIH37_02730 [archaeon]